MKVLCFFRNDYPHLWFSRITEASTPEKRPLPYIKKIETNSWVKLQLQLHEELDSCITFVHLIKVSKVYERTEFEYVQVRVSN